MIKILQHLIKRNRKHSMNDHFSRRWHNFGIWVSVRCWFSPEKPCVQFESLFLQGNTPLHVAAYKRRLPVVQELISADSSPTEKNTEVYNWCLNIITNANWKRTMLCLFIFFIRAFVVAFYSFFSFISCLVVSTKLV